MTIKDYEQFLKKINHLNQLVEVVNSSPEKYELIISCDTHDEVVELAKGWGYEIGRRWGEN